MNCPGGWGYFFATSLSRFGVFSSVEDSCGVAESGACANPGRPIASPAAALAPTRRIKSRRVTCLSFNRAAILTWRDKRAGSPIHRGSAQRSVLLCLISTCHQKERPQPNIFQTNPGTSQLILQHLCSLKATSGGVPAGNQALAPQRSFSAALRAASSSCWNAVTISCFHPCDKSPLRFR